MSVSDTIERVAAKPSVKKFFEDKSVFGLLTTIVAVGTAVVGLIGKILSVDKDLAVWIASALTTDPVRHQAVFKSWFLPILVAILLSWALLALLLLWIVARRFKRSKEQIALDEVMSSVRQIRDQAKQLGIKAWESVHFVYLINKDFSGSERRTNVAKAVDRPLHFLESVTAVEDEAEAAESLSAIKFCVRNLGSDTQNIVYLPSENAQRRKRACLFFLPPIEPGTTRKYETFFQWPGMFRRLKNNSEDFEFRSHTRDTLERFTIEIYLQEGTGGVLECEITGNSHQGQSLKAETCRLGEWTGQGWVYEVKDVPPGDLLLALKAKIRN